MFNELKVLRSKLDPYFTYSDDHSYWKKQRDLHNTYDNLKFELNALLGEARLEYYKVICS